MRGSVQTERNVGERPPNYQCQVTQTLNLGCHTHTNRHKDHTFQHLKGQDKASNRRTSTQKKTGGEKDDSSQRITEVCVVASCLL